MIMLKFGSKIFDSIFSDLNRNKVDQILREAEKEFSEGNIDDHKKYLIDQKIEVLKSLSLN